MQKEGFWYSQSEPFLPFPTQYSQPCSNIFINKLKLLITRLRDWTDITHYEGYSTCRICGQNNGSLEYKIGNYIIPEGLLHYYEKHNVHPSPHFFNFVMKN